MTGVPHQERPVSTSRLLGRPPSEESAERDGKVISVHDLDMGGL